MRMFIQIAAIIVLGYLLNSFLPWYSFAVVAFAVGYFLNSGLNFVAGFLGGSILWAIQIAIASHNAAQDLATKVAQIMAVNEKWILILITLFIAGLVGGLACCTPAFARATAGNSRSR